jgi:hypothetical protein
MERVPVFPNDIAPFRHLYFDREALASFPEPRSSVWRLGRQLFDPVQRNF